MSNVINFSGYIMKAKSSIKSLDSFIKGY